MNRPQVQLNRQCPIYVDREEFDLRVALEMAQLEQATAYCEYMTACDNADRRRRILNNLDTDERLAAAALERYVNAKEKQDDTSATADR